MQNTRLLTNAASKYLGTSGRPNTFTRWYAGKHGKEFLNAAWCAMFLSYVANRNGLGKTVGEYAYCPSWVNWFKAEKRWGTKPEIGAIAFFDWNKDKRADHVGVVESINGKLVYCLEGNTGGGLGTVKRQSRNLNDILGFGYPVYPTLTAKPKFHIVVSGDTLIGIAKHYYSDPLKWRDIYNTNKKTIGKDPAMIRPGMKLSLP